MRRLTLSGGDDEDSVVDLSVPNVSKSVKFAKSEPAAVVLHIASTDARIESVHLATVVDWRITRIKSLSMSDVPSWLTYVCFTHAVNISDARKISIGHLRPSGSNVLLCAEAVVVPTARKVDSLEPPRRFSKAVGSFEMRSKFARSRTVSLAGGAIAKIKFVKTLSCTHPYLTPTSLSPEMRAELVRKLERLTSDASSHDAVTHHQSMSHTNIALAPDTKCQMDTLSTHIGQPVSARERNTLILHWLKSFDG
jgi:hypothetical protein